MRSILFAFACIAAAVAVPTAIADNYLEAHPGPCGSDVPHGGPYSSGSVGTSTYAHASVNYEQACVRVGVHLL